MKIKDKDFSIKSRRLVLSHLKKQQLNEVYLAWINDPVVNYYSDRRFHAPYTMADLCGYCQAMRADEYMIAIQLMDGRHIGNLKIGPIDYGNGAAEVAIMIGDRSQWNQKYGSESLYLISKFLFFSEGLHRLDAGSCNPAFINSVLKMGWDIEGYQKERILLAGERIDFCWLGLLAENFKIEKEYE